MTPAEIEEDLIETLASLTPRQQWAVEMVGRIKLAERDAFQAVSIPKVRQFLSSNSWDQEVARIKRNCIESVLKQEAARASRRQTSREYGAEQITHQYPEARLLETFAIGEDVYARLRQEDGTVISACYRDGKVRGPLKTAKESA